ncbi:MAG: GGDEF domain-containing protein [Burkholderiaceae bacterium]
MPSMINLVSVPTVLLLTGLTSLLGAAMLIWPRTDHRDSGPALLLFAGGVLALGVGFLIFALNQHFGLYPLLFIGHTAFAASGLLLWQGSARLCEVGPYTRYALLAFAAYLLMQLLFNRPDPRHATAQIVINSLFLAGCLGIAAWQVHRSPWAARLRSVRMLRALMAATAALMLLRMLAFLFGLIPLQPNGSVGLGPARTIVLLLVSGAPFAYTIGALNITNAMLSARLHQLATTDDLTGLISRRTLNENAQRMLEHVARSGCVALLMIDLDQFKAINDRHGHSVGDSVLRHVADVLRTQLRRDSLIARYGGDEFCALVPVPGEVAAFVIAERLRAGMEASPYRLPDGARIPMTLSIGVTLHRHGATLRQLLDEADRRAYRAKAHGRNRVVADDATEA